MRGTSNSNSRGSVEDRRRRRVYLVETYRANVDVEPLPRSWQPDNPIAPGPGRVEWEKQTGLQPVEVPLGQGEAACRCYRCGDLLTVETVTVDRIVPGAKGGTYRRTNIRPACAGCNSETGGHLGVAQKRAKAVKGQRSIVLDDELRDFLEDEIVSAEQLDAEIAASKAGAR